MLEHVFRRHRVVARLRAGPFGQHLAEFAAYLHNSGHAPMTVRLYVWAAEGFARWLASRHLTLHVVDKSIIGLFLRKRSSQGCRCSAAKLPRKNVRASLRHFLRMLRASGYAPAAAVELTGPIDCLLAEYDLYLGNVAGLAVVTRCYRARYAREFLRHVFGESPIRWERLRPEDVCTFVAKFGQSGLSTAVSMAATCVRSFLRWLQFQGHCLPHLLLAVPRLSQQKRHTFPRVMSEQQLHQFLDLFDRSTSAGRRDYAIVLCQVSLGLRVGEVAALKLDDIDWRSGTIRIAASKTCRGRMLPLTDGIGQAIADYLRNGRPATTCRHVFVRYTFPQGPRSADH